MKKTILILLSIIVLVQGVSAVINLFNPSFFNNLKESASTLTESTAFHIGKVTGIFFKIILGAAGILILLKKPKKRISV
jgi:uncharacterized membrane protein YbhN (UPF0104 family)